MPALFAVAVFALLLAIFLGAWLRQKAEQKRGAVLETLAQRLGLRFRDEAPGRDECFAPFAIFRRGDSQIAANTISGGFALFGRSCALQIGDFHYEERLSRGSMRRAKEHDFSYLVVRLPWRTPPLLIRPEGLLDRVAAAVGFDDIDFESAEFSRRFVVKSADKRFAYDVCHPRMMEFLLSERPPMLHLEHGFLCLTDGGSRWSPEQFVLHMAFVCHFAELWPRHLLEQLEA